jgi:hypothetical protein
MFFHAATVVIVLHMRNTYKFFNALFLGCTLVLGSCGKDDDVVPVETPEGEPVVSVTQPNTNQQIKGTITITGSVTLGPKSTLDKVTVSVDDVVLKEIKEKTISLDWNSETVTNGTHTIKVVATTVSGKSAQLSVPVKVDNIGVLADFDVPFDYLPFTGNSEVWFWASDEQGNTIDIVKVQRRSHAILLRKNAFKGETFTLTGVVRTATATEFYTLANFKSGIYTLPSANDSPSRSSVGDATITFTDHPGGNSNTDHFKSGSMSHEYNPEPVFKSILFSNPASYLYTHSTGSGQEYMTGDIVPGDNITRSVSEMTPMTKQDVNFAKGQSAKLLIGGNRVDGYYYSYYSAQSSNLTVSRKIPLYIPPGFFDTYNIELLADDANGVSYAQYFGNARNLPTEMSYMDCTIDGLTVTGNIYKASIQGSCDYVYSRSYETVGSRQQEWKVWTAPNAELVMPKIPAILRTAYSDLREYTELSKRSAIYAYDFDEIADYAGYVETPYFFMDFILDNGWQSRRTVSRVE